MLIRLDNDELLEYPDELGALVLADPRDGDVPDFSLDVLNALLSSSLGLLFNRSQTLEQNIVKAREHYTKWGNPSAANLEKALALIKNYNENIAPGDIGYSERELIDDLYSAPGAKNVNNSSGIDQTLESNVFTALQSKSKS